MNGSPPPAKSRQSHGGRFAAFGSREDSSYQLRGKHLCRQADKTEVAKVRKIERATSLAILAISTRLLLTVVNLATSRNPTSAFC